MRRCVELIARERSAISVASKPGERIALRAGYVHVPRQHTRLTYYVDEALKQAGFRVPTGLNPSAAKLIYEPAVRLITGNGPQTIDAHARTIRSIVSTRPVLSAAGAVAPAATH